MSNSIEVSQDFMNDLNHWKNTIGSLVMGKCLIPISAGGYLPDSVFDWWKGGSDNVSKNIRLINLIDFVNGDDIFEAKKEKQYMLVSNHSKDGVYTYLSGFSEYVEAKYPIFGASFGLSNLERKAYKTACKEALQNIADLFTDFGVMEVEE
ncbi:MAG: hypothetical protein LBT37_06395 [Lactobacillaceae bacterium]|jgi:hypothetical protein|nr:hypothetical protein [Lactobacillaceae bacterium]